MTLQLCLLTLSSLSLPIHSPLSFPGLSMALAIDLCIRHGLVAALESLLSLPSPDTASNTGGSGDNALMAVLEEVRTKKGM